MRKTEIITEIRWMGNDRKLNARLRQVLDSWLNTKYKPGQRAKRIAVDCTQFGAAVLDELFRATKPTFVPRFDGTIALHNMRKAYPTMKAIRRMHFGMDIVRNNIVMPGDFLVTRAEHQAEAAPIQAHVMIAGPDPNTAYHAIPHAGVCKTTLAATRGIVRIYRPRRKDLWPSTPSI